MNYSFFSRIKFLSFCILLFAFILISKLFLLQVIETDSFKEKANRQYATPSSNIFERGGIYFETKDGDEASAAIQASGFKVAIDAGKIINAEDTYLTLSKIISIDHDNFITSAGKKNDPYAEIAHHLTQAEADAISGLNIPGVNIFKEKWRFYPGSNLASHTLGFVGYQGNELSGRYGLERQYNSTLARGINNPYINFFAEIFSNIHKTLFENQVSEGDIITTIEPQVQSFLEQELNTVKDKYQVDSIGGIIMNPEDGSIYAMSAKPDFDPNNFGSVTDMHVFSNPLVENVFEFGSVVKPLVMAGALDAGVVAPDTTYNDKGEVTIEKHQIFNFDKKGRGPGTTMQDVLNQSLNTGMVFVEGKLGKVNLRNYLLSYGVKEKTGIDLPNETSGLVSGILTSPREIEYANAAFGQGIAFTPIEMIRALASLGNNGDLVVPHVVKYIKYDDGTKKELTYPTTPTKISKNTSEEITRMLVTVMDKSFDKLSPGIERYSIAAKTGTAQVANPSGGGYYNDRYTHSFMGYFPAYDPKFIVFLYAVNPKGIEYASQTWASPFLEITKFLLNYYEVPPDR